MNNAKQVYQAFKNYLKKKDFHFTAHDDDLTITYTARGDDLPLEIIIRVHEDRQIASILSPLPFTVSEDKLGDLAYAATVLNNTLLMGSFDMDLDKGSICYRIAQTFRGTTLTEEQIQYMIGVTYSSVDEYNDKFFMLEKGMMTTNEFIKKALE